MSKSGITEQFDRLWSDRPAPGPLMRARSEALAAFAESGMPTRRQEQWRYTDLRALGERRFTLAPPAPGPDPQQQARALAQLSSGLDDALRLVFVDGHLIDPLPSAGTTAGLELKNLADEPESLLGRSTGNNDVRHVLADLNKAFAQQGVIVRVAAGVRLTAPIELVFVGGGAELAPQPRVVIDLGENAGALVVLRFLELDGAGPGWLNLVTEIRQAAGSNLTLYRLQEHGAEQWHTSLVAAEIGRDALLTLGGIELGAKLVRNDIDVSLADTGAATDLYGVSMAGQDQHVDNHLRVDHRAAHTTSNQAFRTIAAENGRGVFNGKVIVREGAQKIDARQKSDNLLLSDKAEIDTKPELEIYADDVKCSHGATVGELDENHLFYLRARGLDEQAARGLLTFAFANALIARISLPALRERAASRLAGQLPETFDPDEQLQ